MPDTRFDPAVNGFHFVNTYLNYFVPGVTTGGRCGGMSYAALDFFFAGQPVPLSQSRQVKGIDATARGVAHIDLFACGTDNAVWHKNWDGIRWSDWSSIGGALTSGPDACSWGPGRVDV